MYICIVTAGTEYLPSLGRLQYVPQATAGEGDGSMPDGGLGFTLRRRVFESRDNHLPVDAHGPAGLLEFGVPYANGDRQTSAPARNKWKVLYSLSALTNRTAFLVMM